MTTMKERTQNPREITNHFTGAERFIDKHESRAALTPYMTPCTTDHCAIQKRKGVTMAIQEGKTAPAFTLPDQNGNKVALKDFRGKNVILYFYPKDNTSG